MFLLVEDGYIVKTLKLSVKSQEYKWASYSLLKP